MSLDDVVTAERGRLFGLAYRMLGTASEAEDAVQEAFSRLAATTLEELDEAGAWLTTVTTRLCIDRLRAARHQREAYVGPWLPEPVATDDLDPAAVVEASESLTLAFLVVLESLSPIERAVFLLHDVFGHPFDEVATMVDRSPAAVRKAASRARRHIDERRPAMPAATDEAERVVAAFVAACDGGDLDTLLSLVAPDVTMVSDGGGRASALPAPVTGAAEVARILLALVRTGQRRGATATPTHLNAAPALLVHERGVVTGALVFTVVNHRITRIDGIRNPDKLATLTA